MFAFLHIPLHFLLPGLVARWLFVPHWRRAWLVMALTMVVDLDHLWAEPLYDPGRCSIGFHPLHRWPAVALYAVALSVPMLRVVATGLLIHMALDGLDCVIP